MYCYQCEQTAGGTACVKAGVCGKDGGAAALQDLIVQAVKSVALWADRARRAGMATPEADTYVVGALFRTVTNVNFDPADLAADVAEGVRVRDALREAYAAKVRTADGAAADRPGVAVWRPEGPAETWASQAAAVGIESSRRRHGETAAGLRELVLYGLKGAAAYADHARVLGREDAAVYGDFHAILAALTRDDLDAGDLLALAMRAGELNYRVMELLDRAHTDTFGHPRPTAVRITPVAGPAILVSGHDLKDLRLLLEQTAGTGVQVYTHGEMLPAHGYPELKQHPHLAGNYGGAWQDQQKEFESFPGAILMTTNCIQKPRASYAGRIFTSGRVGWPGVRHIADGKFAPVIEAARAAGGFKAAEPERTILTGFGHQAVLSVAGQVVEAVRTGAVKHLYLIGGCDGAKSGRNYYTEAAEKAPPDSVILTLACGKYRFNKRGFGTVAGLPRLMDLGQCNDAYTAIRVAAALAEAFGTDVNGLPLTLILSWYEQKAVAILLTLLHLGIRNIRLGPSLPAFLTPEAAGVLVDKFNLAPISAPEADLGLIEAGS